MRVLVVGATGVIGRAVVAALSQDNEVIQASRSSAVSVDIADESSIDAMYDAVGKVDAVVSCAGSAAFRGLTELSDADFELSLRNKLMGQVNLVRSGIEHVTDGGSFTLTSGVLSHAPMPGSAAISLVNAGLEAFGRAAALEMPRGIRINVVSPGWVTVTLAALGMDPSAGVSPATVARAYVTSVTGSATGQTIEAATRDAGEPRGG